MTMDEVRDFLYQEIPLAKAMGIEVRSVDEKKSRVTAPLKRNDNHMGTGFGGSITSLLITSCYTWLFYILSEKGFSLHVLIKSGQTDYHFPVEEDLEAVCFAPSAEELMTFLETFSRKGRAKLVLNAHMQTRKGTAASFKGEFVAKKTE